MTRVTIETDELEVFVQVRDAEGNWNAVDPVPPHTERSYHLGAEGTEINFREGVPQD